MLTNALKIIINNPFNESFYEKKQKQKKINILTIFLFISHKSDIKIFLK